MKTNAPIDKNSKIKENTIKEIFNFFDHVFVLSYCVV